MGRFVQRRVTVEARVHNGSTKSAQALADWINEISKEYDALVIPGPQKDSSSVSIYLNEKQEIIDPSIWVVDDVTGDLEFYTDAGFNAKYTPVKEKN